MASTSTYRSTLSVKAVILCSENQFAVTKSIVGSEVNSLYFSFTKDDKYVELSLPLTFHYLHQLSLRENALFALFLKEFPHSVPP